MAEIRLRLREADGELPDVCMRCGEPSTVIKTKNMSWCPPWVGILILVAVPVYIIVALIMTKRARVQVPLCDQHKGHWFNRTMLTVGTFFLFAAICIGGFILVGILGEGRPGRNNDDMFGLVCVVSAVLGLIWLIILIAAQNTAMRPSEITDTEITIKGVAQEFVDAVELLDYDDRPKRNRRSRDDDEDEDDRPRAKKKRPPVDDDDEPKPRKKRPPSDSFEED